MKSGARLLKMHSLPQTVLVSYAGGMEKLFHLDVEVRKHSVLVHLFSKSDQYSAEYYLLFRCFEEAYDALLQGYTLTEEDYWRFKFEKARQLGNRFVEMPSGQTVYMPVREEPGEEPQLVDIERGNATVRIVTEARKPPKVVPDD